MYASPCNKGLKTTLNPFLTELNDHSRKETNCVNPNKTIRNSSNPRNNGDAEESNMANKFIKRPEIVSSQDHSRVTKPPAHFQHQMGEELTFCIAPKNQCYTE